MNKDSSLNSKSKNERDDYEINFNSTILNTELIKNLNRNISDIMDSFNEQISSFNDFKYHGDSVVGPQNDFYETINSKIDVKIVTDKSINSFDKIIANLKKNYSKLTNLITEKNVKLVNNIVEKLHISCQAIIDTLICCEEAQKDYKNNTNIHFRSDETATFDALYLLKIL